MHKTILVGIRATSLAAPVAAYAQPAPPAAPKAATEEVFSVRPAQWLAVGGYLATVWYNGREVQLQVTTSPKA